MAITRRDFGRVAVLSAGSLVAVRAESTGETPSGEARTEVLRGRIICLTEDYKQRFQVRADCGNRGHVWVLKSPEGKINAILPTDSAAAIILDEKVRSRDLQITARVFPESSFAEVIQLQAVHDGTLYNLFYFCEVCNIRTHKPGPCDCCQKPVEFREVLTSEDHDLR